MNAKRSLIVGGVVVAWLVLQLGAVGVGEYLRGRKRAADAEVEAERAADRAEARAAFAAPAPPTPAEAEEFNRVFTALGAALDRGDEAAVTAHFDADRITTEMVRLGLFEKLGVRRTRRDQDDFSRGMRTTLGATLVSNELMRWTETRVRAVRRSADGREAVVIATHRGAEAENLDVKMRWWLIRVDGQWRVYDLEDLDLGTRLTQIAVASLSRELVAGGPAALVPIQTGMAAVRASLAASLRQDYDEAERALAPARGVKLPDPLAALRELAEAAILLSRQDHAGTLARLAEADRLLPGMPAVLAFRAVTLNLAGRHAEALAEARKYVAELGPDPTALSQAGFALEKLDRPAEAAAEYRRALDEGPSEVDALAGLLRVLPADQKAEVGDRLAKTRDPRRTYDELIQQARDDGDAAGVAALRAGLRKARPNDPAPAEEGERRP